MTLPLSIQIFDPAETLLREFSICLDLPAGSGEISHFNYSKLHTPVGKQSAKAFWSSLKQLSTFSWQRAPRLESCASIRRSLKKSPSLS